MAVSRDFSSVPLKKGSAQYTELSRNSMRIIISCMLTELEVTLFRVFGFVKIAGLLSADDLSAINADFDVGLADAEGTMERASFRKQLNWWNLRPDTPFLAGLMEDPRFVNRAKQLLGENIVGLFSASNSFDGDRTDWHPDSDQPNWRGLKFGIYPQALDETTGALRLIPGSHQEPLHSGMKGVPLKDSFLTAEGMNVDEQDGLWVNEVPSHIAAVEPGDVLIFDNYTWHGSYGGKENRRLVTMGYCAAPTTPAEEEAFRRQVENESRARAVFPLLRRHPAWVENKEGGQERQRWITTLQDYGFIAAQD